MFGGITIQCVDDHCFTKDLWKSLLQEQHCQSMICQIDMQVLLDSMDKPLSKSWSRGNDVATSRQWSFTWEYRCKGNILKNCNSRFVVLICKHLPLVPSNTFAKRSAITDIADMTLETEVPFFVSSLPRFEKFSFAKHALAYWINWEIYTL
jgi:hypothetical protein